MPIHLGKTPSREGWIGFETDPHLTRTKARLKTRCLPCMTGLYEALAENPLEIELTHAWECWKITLVVRTVDECIEVLQKFEEKFPRAQIYGKYGGGVGRRTSAVIFHTESEAERDQIEAMLKVVAAEVMPGAEVFVSRGCSNPYERLLGPWRDWQKRSRVKHPERTAEVRNALRDSLYKR